MVTKERVVVHPWYKGNHEWKVNGIAEVPQPIHYDDSQQGKVAYAPKILLLGSERLRKVLWFTYWIATSKTGGKLKWGQGSPMLEEEALLDLLKQATEKGFFSEKFLTKLYRELDKALK